MLPKKTHLISKHINFKVITIFGVIFLVISASWNLKMVSTRQQTWSTNKPEKEEVVLGVLLTRQHIIETNTSITGEVHHDEVSTVENQSPLTTEVVHHNKLRLFENQPQLTTLCAVDKVADDTDNNVTSDVNFKYDLHILSNVHRIHDDNVRKQGHFERVNLTKRLPTCLIIGVAKAGTEELKDFMGVHPYVVITGEEMDYFNTFIAFKKSPGNYRKGPIWYKTKMPESYASQITIEKTPRYFCSPEAPKRVHDMNKDMKLILILREPSSRVMSHVTWRQEKLKLSIENTNVEDYLLKNGRIDIQNEFVSESMYVTCMKPWLQYFDLSQFLIIDSNEFRENPLCVLQKIETFLGLEHVFNNETFVFNKQKGFYCVKETIQTGTKYTNAYCYDQRRGRIEHSTNVNATIIRALESFFKPYNEDLFQLIGQRFDWGNNE